MPIPLRDALGETFAQWKDAMPPAWKDLLDSVELDSNGVPADLSLDPWVPIFPVLADQVQILGGPRFADTFRAFRDLRPRDVRAVVLGQDPYPDVAKATGLSFEQGNLQDWVRDDLLVSKSLRRIVQAAAALDTRTDSYLGTKGWHSFVSDTRDGTINPRSPARFFDETREQGVLWLNTTLSISLFRGHGVYDHQPGHRAFWKPFVERVLKHLATRDRPCVFVLWGGWAKEFQPALSAWASAAGTEGTIGFTEARHPAMSEFLLTNPLGEVNAELIRLGLEPIDWL